MTISFTDRLALFWVKVDRRGDDECWLWTGARGNGNDSGYGYFHTGDRSIGAHRVSYALANAAAPADAQIDHLCRNRLCVNPRHLEAVSSRENTLRGEGPTAVNKRKTHCIRGHALEGGNLMLRKNGWRDCRICKRASNAASMRRAYKSARAQVSE